MECIKGIPRVHKIPMRDQSEIPSCLFLVKVLIPVKA